MKSPYRKIINWIGLACHVVSIPVTCGEIWKEVIAKLIDIRTITIVLGRSFRWLGKTEQKWNYNQWQKFWDYLPLYPHAMLVANLLAHFCSALPSIVLYHIESTSKANFGSFFGGFFYENVESLNNFCYWLSRNW